jgi:hypothetical protein
MKRRPRTRKRRQARQPTDDEFRYELWKRSGWADTQLPAAARSGDREALEACADYAAVILEELDFEPTGLRDWLIDALCRIREGQSPDEAFGSVQAGKIQRRREFKSLRKRWLIVQHMEGLVGQGKTIDEAREVVAKQHHVSAATAEKYYKQRKG